GEPVESFTILTTGPNELVAPLHDRMPVILPPDGWDTWLDPGLDDPLALSRLLGPHPPEGMIAYPVTPAVGSPSVDEPACIEPLHGSREGSPETGPSHG
ncbi:MAG: SOS response-associated peptidase, partial [Acidobacteria bacterium]|nr:SOS response-associated peptidase [Acidobacteriota bacterium]